MSTKPTWKHQNTPSPLPSEQVTHIAVFDDEKRSCVTLYLTDGKLFFPARDVLKNDRTHFNRTLTAWSETAPLLDRRRVRTMPLPGRVANPEDRPIEVVQPPSSEAQAVSRNI